MISQMFQIQAGLVKGFERVKAGSAANRKISKKLDTTVDYFEFYLFDMEINSTISPLINRVENS